eukprot:351867-Chlamydomonas_euryale.AAC.2
MRHAECKQRFGGRTSGPSAGQPADRSVGRSAGRWLVGQRQRRPWQRGPTTPRRQGRAEAEGSNTQATAYQQWSGIQAPGEGRGRGVQHPGDSIPTVVGYPGGRKRQEAIIPRCMCMPSSLPLVAPRPQRPERGALSTIVASRARRPERDRGSQSAAP